MTAARIRTSLTLGIIGAAAWGLAPARMASGLQPPAAGGNKPLVSWIGAYSKVEKGLEISRIADEETWKKTWARHMGDKAEKTASGHDATPEVDFSACMVLAIFRGKSANNDGEYIVSIDDRGADLLVRFDSRSFQSMAVGDGAKDPADGLTPYGIFVLARSVKPIVVEENVQSLIGAPPIWKEQTKIAALTK